MEQQLGCHADSEGVEMADRETIAALREALDDEYHVYTTYRRHIETYGPIQPFVNIVEAEGRHAEALLTQFRRFGVAPPVDTWPGRVIVPATLAEACEAAVQAELDNAAIYDRLLAEITDPQVRDVLLRLKAASQERHLPALRLCLARETGDGARRT